MNHYLRPASIILGLGCILFAWSSVFSARCDGDRTEAADSRVHARESAALLTPKQPASDSLEQPWPQGSSERIARPSDLDSTSQTDETEELVDQLDASTCVRPAEQRNIPSGDALKPRLEILRALRAIGSAPEERAPRIQLIERYLELFPRDPASMELLQTLIAENLRSDAALALGALDRYGSQVVTESAKLDGIRGHLLVQNRRFEDGRACYERVLLTASDARTSADASYWIAYSYLNEGRDDEAKIRFRSLISRYEGDSSVELFSTIQGARNQLELIEKYAPKHE